MSWTYDVETLADSLKDQIRLKIGDTDPDAPLLEDEEINFFITNKEPSLLLATLDCLNVCIMRISNLPDYKLGPYSESHTSRLKYLTALRDDIQQEACLSGLPASELPTTENIFSYDIMSSFCCRGKYE